MSFEEAMVCFEWCLIGRGEEINLKNKSPSELRTRSQTQITIVIATPISGTHKAWYHPTWSAAMSQPNKVTKKQEVMMTGHLQSKREELIPCSWRFKRRRSGSSLISRWRLSKKSERKEDLRVGIAERKEYQCVGKQIDQSKSANSRDGVRYLIRRSHTTQDCKDQRIGVRQCYS